MPATPTSTLEELDALFAWNPPRLRFHPSGRPHVGPDTEGTRQATFYNRHFAPDIICKRLVHLKNLHSNIAAVVDEKLQSYSSGVAIPPQSGIVPKALRETEVEETEDLMKDEWSVVEFYSRTTTRYCVRIASTLALHPAKWSSLLHWSGDPCLGDRDVPGGSLQVLSSQTLDFSSEKGSSNTRRDIVEPQTWSLLMEARNKYEDLATWRMMTPTAEDTSIMLGIMDMAYAEEFRWPSCIPPKTLCVNDLPKFQRPQRALDSPETMSLVGDLSDSGSGSTKDLVMDRIVDDALKRGGSSLESVLKHDHAIEKMSKSWSDSDSDATGSSRAPTKPLTSQRLIEEVS